jgi:bacillithiol system protein YtxJ
MEERLSTSEEVKEFIKTNRIALIFKAGSCNRTTEAWKRVKSVLESRQDLAIGYIEVVAHREASTTAAQISGKKHESPQILVFIDGTCLYAENHWRISPEALAANIPPQ